jgi:hypothetical protein
MGITPANTEQFSGAPDRTGTDRGLVRERRPIGANRLVDAGALDVALECFECTLDKAHAEDPGGIDRSRKTDAARLDGAEPGARIVRQIADENDRAVSQRLGFLKTADHERDADAAAALVRLDRERSQHERAFRTDNNRPEAHRAAQRSRFDGDEAQRPLRRHAFPQAKRTAGETSGPEASRIQCIDKRRIFGPFGPDVPLRPRLFHGPDALASLVRGKP